MADPLIVVDAHEDIAYNALSFGRDYRKPAYQTRREEAGTDIATHAGQTMFGLPDSILGRVAVIFSTLFVLPARVSYNPTDSKTRYTTPQEAYTIASRQLDYYRRIADEDARFRLIETQRDLADVLATWADDVPLTSRVQGAVLLMENADPILEPKQFEEWYERGVRIVGPAWAGTRYTGGTGEPGPLTDLGRDLLENMAGLNAILDLSHMAEEAYFESLDRYEGVIIASHSNPRQFRTTDRHLSDDMIRRLAERDGVMGIVFYSQFLRNDYAKSDPKARTPYTLILDVIDHVCQVVGDAAHVGIGTDFDGGFGAEQTPEGFDTITDLWSLRDALKGRGFSETDVAAILGGNMLRQLRRALPV